MIVCKDWHNPTSQVSRQLELSISEGKLSLSDFDCRGRKGGR